MRGVRCADGAGWAPAGRLCPAVRAVRRGAACCQAAGRRVLEGPAAAGRDEAVPHMRHGRGAQRRLQVHDLQQLPLPWCWVCQASMRRIRKGDPEYTGRTSHTNCSCHAGKVKRARKRRAQEMEAAAPERLPLQQHLLPPPMLPLQQGQPQPLLQLPPTPAPKQKQQEQQQPEQTSLQQRHEQSAQQQEQQGQQQQQQRQQVAEQSAPVQLPPVLVSVSAELAEQALPARTGNGTQVGAPGAAAEPAPLAVDAAAAGPAPVPAPAPLHPAALPAQLTNAEHGHTKRLSKQLAQLGAAGQLAAVPSLEQLQAGYTAVLGALAAAWAPLTQAQAGEALRARGLELSGVAVLGLLQLACHSRARRVQCVEAGGELRFCMPHHGMPRRTRAVRMRLNSSS